MAAAVATVVACGASVDAATDIVIDPDPGLDAALEADPGTDFDAGLEFEASTEAATPCSSQRVGPIYFTNNNQAACEDAAISACNTACAAISGCTACDVSSISVVRRPPNTFWECYGAYQNPNPNRGSCR